MVECLECNAAFELPEGCRVGEVIECPNCGTQLEVFSVAPPIIDLFEEEEK
jgi:alpha-aminoadipate carrier protein LysW